MFQTVVLTSPLYVICDRCGERVEAYLLHTKTFHRWCERCYSETFEEE